MVVYGIHATSEKPRRAVAFWLDSGNLSVLGKVIVGVFKNLFQLIPGIAFPAGPANRCIVTAVSVAAKVKSLIRHYKAVFVLENESRADEVFPAGFCLVGKSARQCKGPADKKLDVRSAQINVQLRATKESD